MSKSRMVLPPVKTIDVDGVETFYHVAGAGEPIVFVYGGNFGAADFASSARIWDLNFAPLSRRHQVIAFDKLGQGFSGNPKRDDDYTMSAVVRHAADFIAKLKLPPVHIVGHSRGGFAVVRLAIDYPHLVRSVTVVSSGTLSPRVGANEITLSACPYPPFTRKSARWVYERSCYSAKSVTDEWVDPVYEVLQLPKYRESVKKIVDEQLGTKVFLPELAKCKRELFNWLREGRLQRPTQIIFGNNDPTAATEGAFDLFDMIGAHQRKTQVHIINQAGHFGYREHPERFNALLDGFVDLVSRW
jgi:2-hydroxy-6-oxonona-2,4-dienedioate hydrolase